MISAGWWAAVTGDSQVPQSQLGLTHFVPSRIKYGENGHMRTYPAICDSLGVAGASSHRAYSTGNA
jgi:hypothetical protein